MTSAAASFTHRHRSDEAVFSVPRASRCILYAAVAIAVARAPVDAVALASDAFSARAIAARGTISVVFGAETPSAGSPSGALGWLGSLIWNDLSAFRVTLWLGTVALLLAMLLLVELRARSHSNGKFGAMAAALAAMCSCDAAHAGGPLEAPLITAALMMLLDRPTLRRALLGTVVVWVWCNVSASGVLGAALAFAGALGSSLERKPPGECRAAWFGSLGACVAMIATPAGLGYPLLAVRALGIMGTVDASAAIAPSEIAPLAYHVGFLLVLVFGLAVGLRARRLGDALPALVALLIGFANGAYLPLVGVVAAPLLAAGAFPLRANVPRAAALTFCCVAALLTNVAANDTAANVRAVSARDGAAAAIRAARLPHVRRLVCVPAAWCAAAVNDGGRVLADDRVERAPPSVRDAQRAFAAANVRWRDSAARYGIDAIVIDRDSALASLLRLDAAWRFAGAQGHAALFVRMRSHS